jgi:hypothetical protein
VRIGDVERPPPPSSRSLGFVAALAAVAGAAALWAFGRGGEEPQPQPPDAIEVAIPAEPTMRSEPQPPTGAAVDPFFPEAVPTSPDAAAAETVEMLAAAAGFWETLGSGGAAAAVAAVDGSFEVAGYAGFVAELSPRFSAADCARLAANAVACSITVHNAGVIAAGISSPTARGEVTFRHGKVEWFDLHPVVASASVRLAEFARIEDAARFAPACRAAAAEPGNPAISRAYDATPACGRLLASVLDDYLAANLPAPAAGPSPS